MPQAAAHEIAHLFNLNHPDEPRLADGKTKNPAATTVVLDGATQTRLMYSESKITNIRLIKPEWDILNPDTPTP